MNAVVKRKKIRKELKERLNERRRQGTKNAKYKKISVERITIKVKININCTNGSEEGI
jgi:hypothetical protein